MATAAFAEQGRGALVVDTTTQPVKGAGHPFAYFPQAIVEEQYDEDVNRIVREYDPEKEFVVVMMKSEGRTSTYRVQPQRRQS